VQNHSGTYSAPKGRPRWIKGKLESLLKTAKRETCEEVFIRKTGEEVIKCLKTKKAQTKKIVRTLLKSGTLGCVQIVLSDNRLIRLYIVAIKEEDFSFEVKDKNENSVSLTFKNQTKYTIDYLYSLLGMCLVKLA